MGNGASRYTVEPGQRGQLSSPSFDKNVYDRTRSFLDEETEYPELRRRCSPEVLELLASEESWAVYYYDSAKEKSSIAIVLLFGRFPALRIFEDAPIELFCSTAYYSKKRRLLVLSEPPDICSRSPLEEYAELIGGETVDRMVGVSGRISGFEAGFYRISRLTLDSTSIGEFEAEPLEKVGKKFADRVDRFLKSHSRRARLQVRLEM